MTAVLGLDATVVLLTPAAFAAAAKARLNARPHVYACTHLANSASLLLPVSNLTNLLAFRASEPVVRALRRADGAALGGRDRDRVGRAARRVFAGDARGARARTPRAASRRCPRAPLAVLAFTLAGFVAAGPLGARRRLAGRAPARCVMVAVERRRRAASPRRSTSRCWGSCSASG